VYSAKKGRRRKNAGMSNDRQHRAHKSASTRTMEFAIITRQMYLFDLDLVFVKNSSIASRQRCLTEEVICLGVSSC